jgi:TonB family protein
MFEQIPASSESLIEKPRIRKRVLFGLALFIIGSGLLHISFGSSVAAMSSYWRNAGPSDKDGVSVITLSRSIHDPFEKPKPTPTPTPIVAKRTALNIAMLKYLELGAERRVAPIHKLARRVAQISLDRPAKFKPADETAPRVSATEVPNAQSHSATSAAAYTGGTGDELANNVVWGDDNPARVVREAPLPAGLPETARSARVDVEIGPDAEIIDVTLVQSSGNADFDAAAVAAAKQSVYAPATLNGLPVHGDCTLEFPNNTTSPA